MSSYFTIEKKRLVSGLSKRYSDFSYIGCYIGDVQYLLKTFEGRLLGDSKIHENLYKFCDTVWNEGFKDGKFQLDGIIDGVQKLERPPI